MSIAENIAEIEERILKSCGRAARERGEITLMGVSKFVPFSLIKEAYGCGIRCFGESRVKEALEKFGEVNNGARDFSQPRNCFNEFELHLIGSLQRNKAKQAVMLFDCVQSVDREELAAELVKHSHVRETPLKVLLELRTGEDSKSGFTDIDDLFKSAEIICGCEKLLPAGLMTMAPFTKDAAMIRASFRKLKKAQNELEKRFAGADWKCLSMGMSNDYEIAIEEGSTMLRIGSAIFKENISKEHK